MLPPSLKGHLRQGERNAELAIPVGHSEYNCEEWAHKGEVRVLMFVCLIC